MITSPKLEERYIVLKIRDLRRDDALEPTREFLRTNGIKTIDCVVVEADWPQYRTVVDMIISEQTPVQGIPYALRNAVEYLDKSELNSIFSGSILHREMKDAIDFPEYAAPQPSDDAALINRMLYHPCTHILIEGLKKLSGGSHVLAEWDAARRKVDAAMGSKGDE